MPTEAPAPALPPYDPTASVAASAVHDEMTVVPMMPDPVAVVHNAATAEVSDPPLPLPHSHPHPAIEREDATLIQNTATTLATANIATGNKRALPAEPVPATATTTTRSSKKRKLRRHYYVEPTEPLPQGIPFHPADFPELEIDGTNNDDDAIIEDHSNLLHAFQQPLFVKEPSAILSIAYSHRDAAVEERKRIRKRKKATMHELQDLRQEFLAKKQELLNMNSQLRSSSNKVGGWTRKVFDLELKEPSAWNDKLHNLQAYVDIHGKIPEHCKKTKGTDEEKSIAAFISGVRSKVKKGHNSITKHPHRIQALEKLGVHWESENDARFEIMFAKLLEYKKEHGTFRMPSLDLCKESGDEELIALHNWVFSQVGSFRYQLKSKKVEVVKRFLDVGFSFERWYGTNGHVFDRSIPPFNAICQRYVANGGIMDEKDVEILNAAAAKSPKKGKTSKKKKKKGKDKDVEVEGTAVAGASEDAAGDMGGEIVEGESKVNAQEEKAPTNTEQQEDNAPAPMEGVETVTIAMLDAAENTNASIDAAGEAVTATNDVVDEADNAPAPMEGVETVNIAMLDAPEATKVSNDAAGEVATATNVVGDAATTDDGAVTAPPAAPTAPVVVDAPQDTPPMEAAPKETVATKMEETAIEAAVEAVATEAVAEQEHVKMAMDEDITQV
eukprot:CAMPEP_0172319798 /NCGR_PEP_ID=MMETSP1058-20130122/38746_1 /TAXON_ID=83371 /ORGANISM="Detonula confervacea, Strain CCMP 353" /LENGTH=670 /DNA_ID=CAMNT_0013034921 /DNA_START=47 /DNA_END=2059 /DNA_ORIENTATION=+